MKKPIYKNWWFWAIIVVILIIIGYAAGGDKSNEKVNTSSTYSSSQTDPQEIDKDDHEDENQSSSETETTIPVVPGSNAYDITVSLKNKGLPEADRSNSSDGYTFSATNEQYSYTINTDKNYALSSAKYYVFGDDNGFLGFCASFPYDGSDGNSAMKWVNDNIGTNVGTTINGVDFVLSVGNQGPILEIKADGRDEYLQQQLS